MAQEGVWYGGAASTVLQSDGVRTLGNISLAISGTNGVSLCSRAITQAGQFNVEQASYAVASEALPDTDTCDMESTETYQTLQRYRRAIAPGSFTSIASSEFQLFYYVPTNVESAAWEQMGDEEMDSAILGRCLELFPGAQQWGPEQVALVKQRAGL